MSWEFYLIGTEFDEDIKGEIESHKNLGEIHLAHSRESARYKIYVLTWSEVITNFELRHKFILNRLKTERDKIATSHQSADEILLNTHLNTASTIYS